MQFQWERDTHDMIQRLFTFHTTFSQSQMNSIHSSLQALWRGKDTSKTDDDSSSVSLFKPFLHLRLNIVNIIYVIDNLSDFDLYHIIRNYIINLWKHQLADSNKEFYNLYAERSREDMLKLLKNIIGDNEKRMFLFLNQLYADV